VTLKSGGRMVLGGAFCEPCQKVLETTERMEASLLAM
jgi:hypothetical protein